MFEFFIENIIYFTFTTKNVLCLTNFLLLTYLFGLSYFYIFYHKNKKTP